VFDVSPPPILHGSMLGTAQRTAHPPPTFIDRVLCLQSTNATMHAWLGLGKSMQLNQWMGLVVLQKKDWSDL
jgi:hypothetical protein